MRRVAAVVCAILIAIQVVRSAAADALAERLPQSAARVWAGHPRVLAETAMIDIASATAARRAVPAAAFAAIREAAAKAPLLPEPFMVRGVQAQLAANEPEARRSFLAAERRDPRLLPAHYFLAEQDLRTGEVAHGLAELAVLANLAPDGPATVAPFVANFAGEGRNWPLVRRLFERNPALAGFALLKLAADPANAEAVMALSDPATRSADQAWAQVMVATLVNAGDYARARALWAALAKVRPDGATPIFDPAFTAPDAPPPFNWALTSSPVGLAERRPAGRLHVIFYGQQDGPLARQLLVLSPGTYRLSMAVAGDRGRMAGLRWSLTCDKTQAPAASIGLAEVAHTPWTFAVPPSCRAQWLELSGSSSDIPQQVEVAISGLSLVKAGANG